MEDVRQVLLYRMPNEDQLTIVLVDRRGGGTVIRTAGVETERILEVDAIAPVKV